MKDEDSTIDPEYQEYLDSLTPEEIKDIQDDIYKSMEDWNLVGCFGNTPLDFALGTLKTK